MVDAPTQRRTEELGDGSRVIIRPICPDDVAGVAAFIKGLSAHSRHLLFLGGIAELSRRELERLCDPDYVHDMAFVAATSDDPAAEHVGVCRYASSEEDTGAEISVGIADAWQHKGLGTLLLTRLIDHARENGIRRLYSVDSAENQRMRRLARHLGFSQRRDPDDPHQVIYSLELTGAAA
jgi:RimJ/RimL family protein N-acetyltransferase